MKNRSFALFTLVVLALNLVGAAFADTRPKISRAVKNPSVAMLPASDAVITLDSKRFLTEAMPQVLSASPTLLGKMTAAIDEMQAKTGVDLRQFETVAAGIAFKKISAKEFDFEPVVIARTLANNSVVIAPEQITGAGKYREEKIGTRTVYVFSAKDLAEKHRSKVAGGKAIDRAAGRLGGDMAVTAFDSKTLIFGTLDRVRQTLGSGPRVTPELMQLVAGDGTIMNFAAQVPNGLKGMLPLQNDMLGNNLDAIRLIYGSMSVNAENTSFRTTARTAGAANAKQLHETLTGFKLIGKAIAGGLGAAHRDIAIRALDNTEVTLAGNEVSLALTVPQGDINALVVSLKK